MELLSLLLKTKKEIEKKTIADYQREALIKEGAKQFKTLLEKGLQVPVALL